MISNLLQTHKADVYALVMKNSSAKNKLKGMDASFKQIEKLLANDLKKLLQGGK